MQLSLFHFYLWPGPAAHALFSGWRGSSPAGIETPDGFLPRSQTEHPLALRTATALPPTIGTAAAVVFPRQRCLNDVVALSSRQKLGWRGGGAVPCFNCGLAQSYTMKDRLLGAARWPRFMEMDGNNILPGGGAIRRVLDTRSQRWGEGGSVLIEKRLRPLSSS